MSSNYDCNNSHIINFNIEKKLTSLEEFNNVQNLVKLSLDSISDLLTVPLKPSNSPSTSTKQIGSAFSNNFQPKRNRREESLGMPSYFDIIEEEEELFNKSSKILGSKKSLTRNNNNTNNNNTNNLNNSTVANVNTSINKGAGYRKIKTRNTVKDHTQLNANINNHISVDNINSHLNKYRSSTPVEKMKGFRDKRNKLNTKGNTKNGTNTTNITSNTNTNNVINQDIKEIKDYKDIKEDNKDLDFKSIKETTNYNIDSIEENEHVGKHKRSIRNSLDLKNTIANHASQAIKEVLDKNKEMKEDKASKLNSSHYIVNSSKINNKHLNNYCSSTTTNKKTYGINVKQDLTKKTVPNTSKNNKAMITTKKEVLKEKELPIKEKEVNVQVRVELSKELEVLNSINTLNNNNYLTEVSPSPLTLNNLQSNYNTENENFILNTIGNQNTVSNQNTVKNQNILNNQNNLNTLNTPNNQSKISEKLDKSDINNLSNLNNSRISNKTNNTKKILNKVNHVLERKIFKSEKNSLINVSSNKILKEYTPKDKTSKKPSIKSDKNEKNENFLLREKLNPKHFLELFLVLNEKTILENKDKTKNQSLFANNSNNNNNETIISKNIKQTLESYNINQNNKHRFSLDLTKINNCQYGSDIINKVRILYITY